MMAASSIPVVESSLSTPKVRLVSLDHPWQWLAAGWKDLWQAPATSISYGLLFVIMGYLLVYLVEARFHYALALTTGFLLAGPFLAMGLYDISRRLQNNEPVHLGHALFAWSRNPLPILLFGLLLGLLMIVWARLSAVLFGVLAGGRELTLDPSTAQLFFSGSGLTFLLIFALVGALVAAVHHQRGVDSDAARPQDGFHHRHSDQHHCSARQSGADGDVGGADRDLHRYRPDQCLSGPGDCPAADWSRHLARLQGSGRE